MKIAIIDGANNVEDIVQAFIGLGHEVIHINTKASLVPMNIDAICSCGNAVSRKKLSIISQVTRKPIVDFRWCCRHLSALLNTKQGGHHDLTC